MTIRNTVECVKCKKHPITRQFPKRPCGDIGVEFYQTVVKYNIKVYKKWGASGIAGTLYVIIQADYERSKC
tara:strand:+ start:243 stop:455 length:213 start_codon:yes stop_codon:yes gene_type:complete